jgi:amino acid adenylation domain-containing protein
VEGASSLELVAAVRRDASSSRLEGLFERMVRLTPNARAVVSGDDVLTYRELDVRGDRIAGALRRHGVRTGNLVGLCVERSLDAVAVLLGIAKAGAAFVPIDPGHPDERLRAILADAEPAVTIVDRAHRARCEQRGQRHVVAIESLCPEAVGASALPVRALPASDDLAYVIYTSGSTGTPKGVMVEHRAVCNMLRSSIDDFNLRSSDRVLQLAPLSFDPSIWQIFGTFAAGACVVLPPPGAERDPDAIVREMHRHGVTVLIAVPTVLSALVERDELFAAPALRDRFRARDLPLYNVYGPTEAAIHVTTHRCADDDHRTFVPIGTPIANTAVYVLDGTLQPVAPGGVGEIFIGGSGLARGYLGRADLTAERFVDDPFAAGDGACMYRTGDLGRRHADGSIEFTGRVDDQVKVRGTRIELGEIVAVLERHARVTAAVAVLEGDERIAAYVVPVSGEDIGLVDALRAHAKSHLPAAGLPATISIVDAFPLLANGKVDRSALARVPQSAPALPSRVEPADPLHEIVMHLWEDVLGVRGIGPHDDFFSLGGHSLMAARLMGRVRARIGHRVPLASFFAEPTIAGMIEAIRENERATLEPIVALRTHGPNTPFFFLHGDVPGLGLYCRRFGDIIADRPIYAIAPHGIDGNPIPETIEEMARDHLRTILAVQPEGPYLLGGYCLGGMVALEITRQLEAMRKDVVHLIIVEAQDARRGVGTMIEGAFAQIAGVFGVHAERSRPWLHERRRALGAALRRSGLLRAPEIAGIDVTHHQIVGRYVWRPVRAPATMICAADARGSRPAQVRRMWSGLFPSLDAQTIPGDHFSSIGRHVDAFTATLAGVLAASGF